MSVAKLPRVRREILLAILESAGKGPTTRRALAKSLHIPTELVDNVLSWAGSEGLISLKGEDVEASPDQRVRMAVHAIRLGADPERVCALLSWSEFEEVSSLAFRLNGFRVRRGFVFRWLGRRWQMDILGCKRPFIICVDCKHWSHRWSGSAVERAVRLQVERTRALASALPQLAGQLGLKGWETDTLLPVVLSLLPARHKLLMNVPIVPILQLQSFIHEFPAYLESLTSFRVRLRAEPPR